MTQYSIHSITCPETAGRAISHGCIGITIEDMLVLYPKVPVGTKVIITDD
jgi:lipoprotein-anchoring transpeptidase ErfK/SrfK